MSKLRGGQPQAWAQSPPSQQLSSACTHCPSAEILPGHGGSFSSAHRRQREVDSDGFSVSDSVSGESEGGDVFDPEVHTLAHARRGPPTPPGLDRSPCAGARSGPETPVLACRLRVQSGGDESQDAAESLSPPSLGAKISSFLQGFAEGSLPLPGGSLFGERTYEVVGGTEEQRHRGTVALQSTGSAIPPVCPVLPDGVKQILPYRSEWEVRHLLESPREQEALIRRVLSARARRFPDVHEEDEDDTRHS